VTFFTIGHSTRSFTEFLALLRAHEIAQLADVRTIPRSRRHPQFSIGALAAALGEAGIAYRHFPALGGLRKPRADSINTGWRNASFRGYADYMQGDEFNEAVGELVAFAHGGATSHPRTVVMCAEAVWWQCHRQLVADALVVRGFSVRHITSPAPATSHTLTEFARVDGRRVTYPGLL
jgi:uncharacterized protein (DUF488 family)